MTEPTSQQLRKGIHDAFDKIANDCQIGQPLVLLPTENAYVLDGDKILVDVHALRTCLLNMMGD